jgi:hypothetical protein
MDILNYWKPETFDIASFKWHLKERVNKEILGNGSDIGSCYYTFNELGFRGDSPKKKGTRVMSVGCSHTEGIGVHNHQTWSHYLTRSMKSAVDLNLGINGRSNDYITRAVLTWVEYLNPDIILVMYTYPHKREYYREDSKIEPYHPKPWGYFNDDLEGRLRWSNMLNASTIEEDYINWYKNHLLITNYLKVKEIPFIWNGTFLQTDYVDENRFDGDYPYFEEKNQYASPQQNEIYSKKLLNHIKQNFEM